MVFNGIAREVTSSAMRSFTMNMQPHINGVVSGAPNWVLRAEGAMVLAGAAYAYSQMHASWLLFAALFLVPDIAMLGYLMNKRIGAIVYNIGHTYILPVSVFVLGWMFETSYVSAIALIWIGHIGFDRMLGYGLKYATGFKINHLSATPS
jgi:Domain of unknown function (DUF4260)